MIRSLLAALSLLAACSAPAPAARPAPASAAGPQWCPAGQTYRAPGCEQPALARAACYTACSLTAPCADDGHRCVEVSVACDPRRGKPCAACGELVELCVPAVDAGDGPPIDDRPSTH